MKYNTTVEQQEDYVGELRKMRGKIARVHGYDSPQEHAIIDILSVELNRLCEMKEMEVNDENA